MRCISIHSYRGGTGKSTTTANLAAALVHMGYKVATVDLDLASPGLYVKDEVLNHRNRGVFLLKHPNHPYSGIMLKVAETLIKW